MIAWALEALVTASLLMLLVLAVRKPIADFFGSEWAYALWLLPLVLPFVPAMPELVPLAVPEMTVILPPVVDAAASAEAAGSSEWLLMLLALWAGGAAAFAIWQQSTYSAFMLHLGSGGRAANPPVYGGIEVVASEAVEGPVAVGILRRRIVVPLDFEVRYTPSEQRLALEHELVHHQRLDLAWNWAALLMLTLNWFNPIAHLAFRAFRADQELACDAAVTRKSPAERHDYARALVKAASRPGLIAVCPLNHADFLKRRLKMMKRHRSSPARTLGGVASLALAAAAGAATSGVGFAHQEAAPSRFLASVAAPRASMPAVTPAAAVALPHQEVPEVVVRGVKKEKAPSARTAYANFDVDAPKLDPAAAAEAATPQQLAVIASMVPAVPATRHELHVAEHRMHVREALVRARARIAAGEGAARQAVAFAHPLPRPRIMTVRINGAIRREVQLALAEAGHAVASLDLDQDLRMMEVELKHELKALPNSH